MSYYRSQEDKRRLKKLHDNVKKSRHVSLWHNERKNLRRIANRKVRRTKMVLRHNQYKKLYDYWRSL